MNKVFTISGPSGVGKTTIINRITNNRAKTTTSRNPREGEIDGTDYYFVSEEEFVSKIKNGEMVEYARYGPQRNYYGLSRDEYENQLKQGDLFIVCDVEGMRTHKKNNPDAVSIFIYAEREEIEKQLEKRGGTKELIAERLALYEKEMAYANEYDYLFMNSYGELDCVIDKLKRKIEEIKHEATS